MGFSEFHRIVVPAEIGQYLEVRNSPLVSRHLDNALALAREATARRDAVEVVVEIDHQWHRRMVARTTRRRRHGTRKAERDEIEFIDADLDGSNSLQAADVVVQAAGRT